MKKWFKDYWQAIPIILALVLLAVALFLKPSNFVNLAWFALVALTAVYAWATLKAVRESKRTMEEIRQSRLDAVKPALSLQPEGFTFGGDFALYLRNSGGVAKEVKIDIEVTNPPLKNVLYVPALNKEHIVRLPLETTKEIYKKGGLVKVVVSFKDSYSQSLTETLQMDFSNLKEEKREIMGQYSEITKALKDIERKIK